MNINDVAREAGVSKTTVSRVLLNSDKVKAETKEKVLEVIKRLNYTPNTSAQILAGKSNKTIGVICGLPISDPFYGYMNDLIADECEKYNYGTIYVVCRDNNSGCDKEIAMLYGKVDAYVLLGMDNIKFANIEKLTKIGMPVALFKTEMIKEGAVTVDIDNLKSGELAMRCLYEKGYRKIGYMRGDNKGDFREGNERYKGFMQEMKRLGLTLEKEFCGYRSYKTAYNLADDVIKAGIDALFCDTDIMAYGVVSALMEKKVKIPEQVAVLGFDDIKFHNFETQIHLSTVAQPMEQMAAYIVGVLVNRIENEIPYEKIKLFDTKIVGGMTI